jgi:beta-aspartyl-dipeptidase (metallo-type)
MLTLIENGDVYAPEPQGRTSVLLVDGRVGKVGDVDRRALESLGVDHEVVDATGCVVAPGLIDPHEHLLGGSGESGFSTQTPELWLSEIVTAGITTVVGCLGVDTTMKTLPGLLAKVKALREEGVSAWMWTGGYNVPPTCILDSVRDDILFVEEVIGCGEVAIADERATDPAPRELARLAHDAHVGGLLSRKAGVTHFHVGDGKRRLRCLRDLLDEDVFQVKAEWLYATHVNRSEALMCEAIDLTRRGATVDVDTVEEDLAERLRFYFEHGGDPSRLTVSSDAAASSPRTLYAQLRAAVVEHRLPLERVLALATENTARVLRLRGKGRVEPGGDADLVLLRERSLEIVDVFARGRRMVKDGELVVRERFLEDSNRRVTLHGEKARQ